MAESAWLQYMSSAFDWSNSTCQPCLTLNRQMVQMSAWWLRFLSWLQAKAHLHLNLFGEYFQSIRILFKHCGHNRKNTNKEDCRVKSESEQIEQDCRAESESGQNFGPLSTTPPSPRAPPAGLLPPLQLPGPGDCKAGYLLPGKEQKPVNILPSATSWLQLE